MTRRHFEALAKAMLGNKPRMPEHDSIQLERHVQWEQDVQVIADVCERFNPNFDTERFILACRGGA